MFSCCYHVQPGNRLGSCRSKCSLPGREVELSLPTSAESVHAHTMYIVFLNSLSMVGETS